jgi:DNA-binding MarR family transcriptional regulator
MSSRPTTTSSIPPETTDLDSRRVLDSLRRIVRVLREASRAAEKTVGLSSAQLFALRELANGAPLSLGQLAARTMTHESSVSVVVRRLVERGLVSRERSTADGRQVVLTLTQEGRTLLKQAPTAATHALLEGLGHLNRDERRQLAGALARLVDVMGLSESNPNMLFEDDPT